MIPIIDSSTPTNTPAAHRNTPAAAAPAVSDNGMESQFLQLLRTARKQDLNVLAKLLMPFIADHELKQLRIWGDKSRVHLDRATISVNDLLVNTRSGHVTIDEHCFFGHRCMLLTGTHDYRKTGMERLKAVPDEGRDIHVKEGVWMGSGVTVLGPAVIGKNAVVAAGSLVTGDVADNTIVAGRPAKPVKTIDGDAL
ncbi:acyltransferase [Modicisalibacter coralii]|uniref:acyltransferase n=1 Tax=Modicisalibacter coralii TaxID=2304602 RepID=UPI00100A52A7|nr:acyltransferase [Halomonas coralii]